MHLDDVIGHGDLWIGVAGAARSGDVDADVGVVPSRRRGRSSSAIEAIHYRRLSEVTHVCL